MFSRDFFFKLYSAQRSVWLWAAWIAVLMLLVIGLRLRMDNSPEIWLPEGDPEVELYERFKNHFGNDSFVAVVAERFGVGKGGEALRLSQELQKLEQVARLETPFEEDGTLEDSFLSSRLLNEEKTRFAFLVALSVEAEPSDILRLLQEIEEVVERYPQFGTFTLVGTEIVTRDLNRGSERSFGGLFPLVAGMLSFLVWLAFRSWRVVGGIFLSVGFSAVAALGTMAIFGATLNLLVVLMPAILVVLTVAGSIHLCGKYVDLARAGSQESLSERLELWSKAAEKMSKPCALATFTTALGFGSLAVSKVGPVADLGLFTAIGSVYVLLSVFLLLPVWVSRSALPLTQNTLSLEAVEGYVKVLARRRLVVVGLGFAVLAGLAAGLPRLHLESNVMTFFDSDHPLPQNYSRFEEDFFGLTSFEILLEGPIGRICSEENLELLEQLEGYALSEKLAADSLSPWLDPDEEHTVLERSLALRAVVSDIPDELGSFVWKGGSSAAIRMTLSAPTGSSNAAFESVQLLRKKIRSLEHPPGVNVTVGGAAPLLVRGQVLLLDTQIRSFATALLSITLVIILAYRSVRLTLLSLICNVFPVAGTLGLMGWLEIPLNAGTVTVAGIALGLIVDDTIHIIHGFAEADEQSAYNNVVSTLSSAGKPILVTSIAVALGFGLFGFASFQPTKYFGLLTAATSLFALVADLAVLPALLLGEPRAGLSSNESSSVRDLGVGCEENDASLSVGES